MDLLLITPDWHSVRSGEAFHGLGTDRLQSAPGG